MYIFDQHMHCSCSFDSHAPIGEMACTAKEMGMHAVCFTDHMDMGDGETGQPYEHPFRERRALFERRREDYERESAAGLTLRLGMELGEPLDNPAEAVEASRMEGLDLVIGSLHHLRGVPDFYFLRYESEAHCEALNHRYLAELAETAKLDCFDVMGHIGYTSRYMEKQGFHEKLTAEKYGDELRTLLRLLIERGKGIECNASGYRDGGTFPYPDADVLRLYRSLGGEIITVGSDAHSPEQVRAAKLKEVYALLQDCGFRAVCEFRERKPHFIDL